MAVNPIGAIKDDYGATLQFDDGSSRYLYGPAGHEIADEVTARAPTLYADPAGAPPGPSAGRIASVGGYAPPEPQNMSVAPATAPEPGPPPAPVDPVADANARADSAAQAYVAKAMQPRVRYTPAYDPQADDASRSAVRQSGSEVVTGAQPMSAETMGAPDRAYDRGAQLAEEIAFNERYAAAQAQEQARQQQAQAARRMLEERRKAQEIEAQVQSDRDAYDRISSDIGSGKIDPRRIMKTPAGMFASIGIALGEIGRAMSGGSTNVAYQMVERAIDRDVAAQEKEFSLKRERAGNMYAQLMQRYGDRDQARAALKAAQAELALREIGTQASARGLGEADLNLQKAMVSLADRRDAAKAELDMASRGKATVQTNVAYAAPRAASAYVENPDPVKVVENAVKLQDGLSRLWGGMTNEQRAELAKEERKQGNASTADTVERAIVENGQVRGFAPSATRAKDVQKALDDMNKGQAGVERMAGLFKENPVARMVPGSVPMAGAAATEINSIGTQLLLGIKSAENLGALDKGSVEVAEKLIPSATDGNPMAKLSMLHQMYRTGRENLLRNQVSTDPKSFDPTLKPTVTGAKPIK